TRSPPTASARMQAPSMGSRVSPAPFLSHLRVSLLQKVVQTSQSPATAISVGESEAALTTTIGSHLPCTQAAPWQSRPGMQQFWLSARYWGGQVAGSTSGGHVPELPAPESLASASPASATSGPPASSWPEPKPSS